MGSRLEPHCPTELPVLMETCTSALVGYLATSQPLVAPENLKCGECN